MTGPGPYHDALMSLARAAHGAGRLPAPAATATRDNPLCGDRVAMDVRVEGGRIAALAHRVRGCVLCQAAASFLGQAAPGLSPAGVRAARAQLLALLAEGVAVPDGPFSGLSIFDPVRAVKSRHTCVLLPFDALAEAVDAAPGA